MQLLKVGAHEAGSGITLVPHGGNFLIQCPVTGTVYVLKKTHSGSNDCYFITPQRSARGSHTDRYAIFQRTSAGRRVHFSIVQIECAIRVGDFIIEKV